MSWDFRVVPLEMQCMLCRGISLAIGFACKFCIATGREPIPFTELWGVGEDWRNVWNGVVMP